MKWFTPQSPCGQKRPQDFHILMSEFYIQALFILVAIV